MNSSITRSLSAEVRVRWSQARKWASRALFAVADQGLISGSHFVLGIQLARYLHPAGYGAYALAFSMFSLLAMLHQAIVLEPLSVFGGSKYRGSLRRYLGQLLGLQTVSGIACLGILLVAAIVVYIGRQSTELALSLLGVGIATPFVLLFAFTRRALYLEYRSNIAAGGAVLYGAFLFAGLWFLNQLGVVSVFTAFLDMGAAAAATSMLLFLYVRPTLKGHSRERKMAIANEHWRYGRWALGSSLCTWITWNLWYAIVSSFTGLAATGTLKALLNLAMPVTQSLAALSLLVLPHAAQVTQSEGWAGAKRQAMTVGSLFAAGAALYWTIIIVCGAPLISFLYAGRYGDTVSYLPWLALASIAAGAVAGPVSALRALQTPATVCLTFSISSVVGLCVGIPGTRAYGIAGAISGILVSSVLGLGIAIFLLGRAKPADAHWCAPELSEPVVQ
jgi:O-antigen/teichoic acid export membrane protein